MDKFPTEILHNIFIQLNLSKRLDCMFVCRHWYNVISQRSLLYDVDIFESSQFSKFKDMIERQPFRGTQVDKITLSYCFTNELDRRKLCNMFPNVREFIFDGIESEIYRKRYHNSYPFEFLYSKSKVERIIDCGECELTRQLAISNLCGRLKELQLCFLDTNPEDFHDVIPQLKNMPVLEQLKLLCIEISIMELETLHNNLPSVSNFSLHGQIIVVEYPHNIKPAALITKAELAFENFNAVQAHIQWYHYISRKYINVTELIIQDFGIQSGASTSEDMRRVFENGVFPFLQVVGPQLGSYVFENLPNGIDVFKKLDDFGCKFHELVVTFNGATLPASADLGLSEQSKYIEDLTAKGLAPDSIDILNNMTSLRSLTIQDPDDMYDDPPEKKFNLCHILNICGTRLFYLCLERVESIPSQPIPAYTTSIEYLNLSKVELTEGLANMISNCFPRLNCLCLSNSLSSDITISLPTIRFKSICLETEHTDNPNGFLIKTMENDTSQYYVLQEAGAEYPIFIPVSNDEYNGSLTLTIICASVKNLELDIYGDT